jgi:NADPH2:quinone reductase
MLKPGKVLIKVVTAPVNPSDYGRWYKLSPSLSYPKPMGKEGCGIVIASASKGGLISGMMLLVLCLVRTRVGFVIWDPTQGSYLKYVAVNAMTGMFPMLTDVQIEDCASFFVNPYTTVGILDTVQQTGSSRAMVHTTTMSQLGQMLNRLAAAKGMEIINAVRHQEQREVLEKLGAKHIIVMDGVNNTAWKAKLRAKVKDLSATCAFNAVSGDMTGHLLNCITRGRAVYV